MFKANFFCSFIMGRMTHYPQLTYWTQPTTLEQSRTAQAPPTHTPTPIRHSRRQSSHGNGRSFTFDNTYDIGNFRAHIAFSAHRRLKNYLRSSEVRPPKQLLADCRLLVPTNNAKGILENLSMGMRMAKYKMTTAPPPPFHVSKRSAACSYGPTLPLPYENLEAYSMEVPCEWTKNIERCPVNKASTPTKTLSLGRTNQCVINWQPLGIRSSAGCS